VEAVLSLAIISIISLACMSVTSLMARSAAASADSGTAGTSAEARDAMDQITRDLKTATSITERSATAIGVSVPDRNGDGSAESIRYAWAGVGSPITRQYNGGAVVSIVASARNFNLAFLDKTVVAPPVPTPPPSSPTESTEQLLCSYEVAPTASWGITTLHYEGEYFSPTLPSGATAWSITKVGVMMKRASSSTTGTVTFQIRAADSSSKPTGLALASASVDVTTIPTSNTWIELPLSLSGLVPGTGMTLVVTSSALLSANANAAGKTGISPKITASSSVLSNDAGLSWSVNSGAVQMEFRVYGTYTTP
jgi:hypothetical protein